MQPEIHILDDISAQELARRSEVEATINILGQKSAAMNRCQITNVFSVIGCQVFQIKIGFMPDPSSKIGLAPRISDKESLELWVTPSFGSRLGLIAPLQSGRFCYKA